MNRNKTPQTARSRLAVGSLVWVTDPANRRPGAATGQARVIAIDAQTDTVDVAFCGPSFGTGPGGSEDEVLRGVPRQDLRTPNAFLPVEHP